LCLYSYFTTKLYKSQSFLYSLYTCESAPITSPKMGAHVDLAGFLKIEMMILYSLYGLSTTYIYWMKMMCMREKGASPLDCFAVSPWFRHLSHECFAFAPSIVDW